MTTKTTQTNATPTQGAADAAAATLEAIGASQAMIEFRPDGTIVAANGNFRAAMGYAMSEIDGGRHSMFVDPAYRESPEYAQF